MMTLSEANDMQKITPFLWFDTEAEAAAKFYVSLFKDAKIVSVTRYGEGAPRPADLVMTVTFELAGQQFIALNGGPEFKFNESVSFSVDCADQAEIDHFWDKLTADGGEESMCGWLKDKYGLSWQVVPRDWPEMYSGKDKAASARAMQAMMQMKKLDIAKLKAAYAGK